MVEVYALSACVFGAVTTLSWWVASLMAPREDETKLRSRLRGTSSKAGESALFAQKKQPKPTLSSVVASVGQAAAQPFMPKSREKQGELRKKLAYAGIYSSAAVRAFQGFKFLLLGAGLVGGYLLGLLAGVSFLGMSVGGLVGYMLPVVYLKRRIAANRRAIDHALADALDLLVICVEAGLTLDAALQRVGQEIALVHPHLAQELEYTHMETRIGVPRSDALRNLGARTGVPSLQMLASMLIQAERFGTGISQSLRIHADTLRSDRQFAAEEAAAKASVKLSFPVVLFIFPAVLIVLAGPAVIGLLNSPLFNE